MTETIFWGMVLRCAQTFLSATPTILIGLLVAAIFRRVTGTEGTRRLFCGSRWRSLFTAWMIGMLLPVCSLGAIPIARELRRAGVPGGTILAFAMTAPLFNPVSVLYGLTLADPLAMFVFCLGSLVIVMVAGYLWDWLFPYEAAPAAADSPVAHGWKRIASIGVFAARELASPTTVYLLIGVVGVGCVSAVLPHGSLQQAAEHDDIWAPLFMSLVAVPVYATPMAAMVQLASMFQHGNSVGAAFALLVLGAGVNLGLVAWTLWNYGLRRTVIWFLLLLLVVLVLAYGMDDPLYPRGVEPAGHTHAFDVYCCPFPGAIEHPAAVVWETLREGIAAHEVVALFLFLTFVIGSAALAIADPGERVERWLEQAPEQRPSLDIVIPGPALGGIALAGLVAASVLGCYLYYPPAEEILEELNVVNTEVVTSAYSRHWDAAAYWIPHYDDWTRKLEVSMVLRGRSPTPDQRAKAEVLRDNLEQLEHEVQDRDIDQSRRFATIVNTAFRQMTEAIRKPPEAAKTEG